MSTAYLNGRFLPLSQARISIEDRGLLFADAVYEVVCVARSRGVDLGAHLDRLWRSLQALGMSSPCSRRVLLLLLKQIIVCNRLRYGSIYLQISRGSASRAHAFPPTSCKANIFMVASHGPPPAVAPACISAVTLADTRWARVDIKTTNLLPNCLGLEEARVRGADEVIFYDSASEIMRESSKSNLWMLSSDNRLLTHPRTSNILGGVTRAAVMELALKNGITYKQEAFTRKQAYEAHELFLTSSTGFVSIINKLDGHSIGEGVSDNGANSIARKLYELYLAKLQA